MFVLFRFQNVCIQFPYNKSNKNKIFSEELRLKVPAAGSDGMPDDGSVLQCFQPGKGKF